MADRSEIESTVIKSTATICKVAPDSLSADTLFAEDLNMKSMQVVKLTVLLEDEFDIKLPMARIRKNKTLSDLVEMIAELLADAGK
jgi:acyl carrier protein